MPQTTQIAITARHSGRLENPYGEMLAFLEITSIWKGFLREGGRTRDRELSADELSRPCDLVRGKWNVSLWPKGAASPRVTRLLGDLTEDECERLPPRFYGDTFVWLGEQYPSALSRRGKPIDRIGGNIGLGIYGESVPEDWEAFERVASES